MNDFSKDDWIDYIKSHLSEFSIQEFEPDKYGLWYVYIKSKYDPRQSTHGEGTNKELAKEKAIKDLAASLFQNHKTPDNLNYDGWI